MITEEKLMAYADGELADEDRAQVDLALLERAPVQEALARERLLRQRLSSLYEPALSEDLPERLSKLVTGQRAALRGGNGQSFRAGRTWWRNVTAIAATLIAGIFLGYGLGGDDAPLTDPDARVAQGELARALDVQLASAQSPDAPIRLGISFVGPEGTPCRTYQAYETVGLACRQGSLWALRLVAPAEQSRLSEYQQAGTASALIMKSAQELMTGEPMDAAEERRARDSGWAPVQR